MKEEDSGPPMPPQPGRNPARYITESSARGVPEVLLAELHPGDRLRIATKNTRYEIEWRENGMPLLSSDREDRPWGPIAVAGCFHERTNLVEPGVLFCGGCFEYVSMDGKVRHRTTPILSLTVLRHD